MTDKPYTNPEVAFQRISFVRDVARKVSIETGGDPAECAFELICAAILVIHESRPMDAPEKMIMNALGSASATVEDWFGDELKKIRCRHG